MPYSDMARSDMPHSDMPHSDMARSDMARSNTVCSNEGSRGKGTVGRGDARFHGCFRELAWRLGLRKGVVSAGDMIGRLLGRVVGEDAVGVILLDVGGVGYEVHCPIGTVRRAATGRTGAGAAHIGGALGGAAFAEAAEIVVYVHTNVRQDALELFGFATLEDRETFRKLITVPNVGPRLALSVLHVLDAQQLAAAIDAGDRALLERVPGVGKKTAERLVLELRGKLDGGAAKATPAGSLAGGPPKSRLVSALTGLGYRPQEAERAARAVEESGAEGEFSALLRLALKHLAP